MKKIGIALMYLLVCLGPFAAQAQDIYMKVYTYAASTSWLGTSLTDGLGPGGKALDAGGGDNLANYIKLSSLQYDLEQTLNIGSQSTGAGAGKIVFNPIVITKTVDAISAVLMQYCAAGKLMNLEFIFVSGNGSSSTPTVRYKMQVTLAAVRTVAISSVPDCGNGCPGIAESYSFDYGQLIVQTYTQKATGEVVLGPKFGWDRVKNVAIN